MILPFPPLMSTSSQKGATRYPSLKSGEDSENGLLKKALYEELNERIPLVPTYNQNDIIDAIFIVLST